MARSRKLHQIVRNDRKIKNIEEREKKIRKVTKRLVSISPLFFDRDDEEHVDDDDDDDGSSSGTSWHDLSNATFRIRGGAARYRKEKGRNETGFHLLECRRSIWKRFRKAPRGPMIFSIPTFPSCIVSFAFVYLVAEKYEDICHFY